MYFTQTENLKDGNGVCKKVLRKLAQRQKYFLQRSFPTVLNQFILSYFCTETGITDDQIVLVLTKYTVYTHIQSRILKIITNGNQLRLPKGK